MTEELNAKILVIEKKLSDKAYLLEKSACKTIL